MAVGQAVKPLIPDMNMLQGGVAGHARGSHANASERCECV